MNDTARTSGSVPTIDFTGLRDGVPAGERRIAAQVGAAARDVGFFAVINHVPERCSDDAFLAARTFFALPLEAKERPAMDAVAIGVQRVVEIDLGLTPRFFVPHDERHQRERYAATYLAARS